MLGPDGSKLGKRDGALPLPSLQPSEVQRTLHQALAILGASVAPDSPERMLAASGYDDPVKASRALLIIAAVGALFGFGRFFLSQLSSDVPRSEPAGILLAAPPGFDPAEGGELDRRSAARRLATVLGQLDAPTRFGLHFEDHGFERLWLVDRSDPGRAVLIERSAGPTGTRLEGTWHGGIADRLAWCAEHGDFEAPGLAPGERRNAYH